nr:hypothetical protein [Streptococcus hyovaginalis]
MKDHNQLKKNTFKNKIRRQGIAKSAYTLDQGTEEYSDAAGSKAL